MGNVHERMHMFDQGFRARVSSIYDKSLIE